VPALVDLINEPSFSNPKQIFRGNVPTATHRVAAWHKWPARDMVFRRWRMRGGDGRSLGSFDAVPCRQSATCTTSLWNANLVRTLDLPLRAGCVQRLGQIDGFADSLLGSRQLIDGDRTKASDGPLVEPVLRGAGVSFTTDHTYWQDDRCCGTRWRPSARMPNITGETDTTGVGTDGKWRYDEFAGLALTERKWRWALREEAAARCSGTGRGRPTSACSAATVGQGMGEHDADLGQSRARPRPLPMADRPEVAIVLPQSTQLSWANCLDWRRSKRRCARFSHYARSQPMWWANTSPSCWVSEAPSSSVAVGADRRGVAAIEQKVRRGVLLVTGTFGEDAPLFDREAGPVVAALCQRTAESARE